MLTPHSCSTHIIGPISEISELADLSTWNHHMIARNELFDLVGLDDTYSFWIAWSPACITIFRWNAYKAFRTIGMGFVLLVRRHEISSSNMLKTVWPRITKFYVNTDIVYSHTGHDVSIYFWPEVIAKKNCRKYRIRQLRVEFLQNGSS